MLAPHAAMESRAKTAEVYSQRPSKKTHRLAALHGLHVALKLLNSSVPPRILGMMWSASGASVYLPFARQS
jgi:hypothetical protein